MRSATAFTEILDEKLGQVCGTGVEPGRGPGGPADPRVTRTLPPPPVLGFFNFAATSTPLAAASNPVVGIAHERGDARPPSSPTTPGRTLAPRDRQALQDLVELGAVLDSSFTPDHLRRAFRMLARRYHPDRHPDSCEAAKAHLSQIFARVRAAYEQLQALALTA